MNSFTSTLVNWTQYASLRAVVGFMQCFDMEENLHTASSVGSVFSQISRKRRKRAEHNIRVSFPEWPEARVRETALRSIQHMFRIFLVESLVTPRLITPSTWTRYVELKNVGPLLDLLVRRKPAIFLTAHYGNWELLGTVLAAIGYPLVALARPLDNPYINRWLLGVRESHGMQIVTKWGATPILQNTLLNNGRLGFIADQNAGEQGLFVPFFGRLASNYKSIGLLAMRYRVPVIVGHATRIRDGFRYELSMTDFIRPEEWVDQPDPLFYIVARYNRAMEEMIRRSPDQYLWLHRRWKSRPKHERLNHAFPKRLMSKLEALPWMTQDELDGIVRNSRDFACEAKSTLIPAA